MEVDEEQWWRETPEYHSSGLGPYLPDTYFINSKRSLLQRPYSSVMEQAGLPEKRMRLGDSPAEHRELVALKQSERKATKEARKGVCGAHKNLVDIPVKVIRTLQEHGVTINKTQEAMDTLMSQVNTLSSELKSAISRLEGKSSSSSSGNRGSRNQEPPPALDSDQYEMFVAYYRVICNMLQKFKRFAGGGAGDSSRSDRSIVSGTRSGSQHAMIRETLECMRRIRELLISQCHFDCDSSSSSLLEVKWPSAPSSITVSAWRPPTWDDVCRALGRMEANMRAFLERFNTQRSRSKESQPVRRPEQSRTSSSTAVSSSSASLGALQPPRPIYTSTPFEGKSNANRRNEVSLKEKRKADDSGIMESDSNNSRDYSRLNSSSREEYEKRDIITPRRVTFSFTHPSAMEVD